MLNQMQNRFKGMSENIVDRIDVMGNRIEDLEKSIAELVNESGNMDENNLDGIDDNQQPGGYRQ
tara:strand:+ start:553 stop:744 length:192 start_codon:yes stop_codon:yes gene_type:complete